MTVLRSPKARRKGRRVIVTERLELVPADPLLLQAALANDLDLVGKLLRASVPDSWPSEYVDHTALQYTLDHVTEFREDAGWWMQFVVRAPRIKCRERSLREADLRPGGSCRLPTFEHREMRSASPDARCALAIGQPRASGWCFRCG